MAEYKEVTGSIKVPTNTGIEGFLHTIKLLMRRPRLQSLEIDARGVVKFRRYALENEDDGGPNNNYGVDLAFLQPSHVIRNAPLRELLVPEHLSAAVVVGLLFDKSTKEQLRPLAFVTNPTTGLWDWYQFSTGHALEDRGSFFGLPMLTDRHIPEMALLLCLGFGKDAAFVDTQVSYKVEIPNHKQQVST